MRETKRNNYLEWKKKKVNCKRVVSVYMLNFQCSIIINTFLVSKTENYWLLTCVNWIERQFITIKLKRKLIEPIVPRKNSPNHQKKRIILTTVKQPEKIFINTDRGISFFLVNIQIFGVFFIIRGTIKWNASNSICTKPETNSLNSTWVTQFTVFFSPSSPKNLTQRCAMPSKNMNLCLI